MKSEISRLSTEEADQVIRMAWEDRSSFERIEERAGLTESQVITLMRRELKPRSFKLWRKRVAGRVTKHRKRFKRAAYKGSFD